MANETKLRTALEAAQELFEDTSVDLQTALENLNTLRGQIDEFINCIEIDIERAEQRGDG